MQSTRQTLGTHLNPISTDDLFDNFRAILPRKNKNNIEAMWNENQSLRDWYIGKPVNFGNDQDPDWRTLSSINDLVSHFKSILSSRNPYVIKAMWDENLLLRDWCSGKLNNNQHIISIDDLANLFRSALSSHYSYIIKAIWNANLSLQDWHSSKPVKIGNDQGTIPFEDLVKQFNAALASRTPYIMKAIWDRNPLLQDWYSGKSVSIGDDQRIISIEALVSHFKSALASQNQYIIKAIWNGNEKLHQAIQNLSYQESKKLLQNVMSSSAAKNNEFITLYVNWFNQATVIKTVLDDTKNSLKNKKQPANKEFQIDILAKRLKELEEDASLNVIDASININAPYNTQFNLIELNELPFPLFDEMDNYTASQPLDNLLRDFKIALSTRKTSHSKMMWDENPSLRDWCNGKQLNINNNQPTTSIDALINHFKLILPSQCHYIINAMWNGNQSLRDWYSGKPVNFGNDQDPDWRTLSSINDCVSHFKLVLISRNANVTQAMWDENKLLRDWLEGKSVTIGNNDPHTISIHDIACHFKAALASRNPYIIQAMWDKNKLLRDWFSSKPVSIDNNQRTISITDLACHFKAALSSHYSYIIQAMWDGNPLLRDWYSGKPVNIDDNQHTLPIDDLVHHFQSALSSQSIYIIKAMWEGNEKLHQAIQNLSYKESKKLLQDIMRSSNESIITQYVNWLNQATVIKTVLDDAKNNLKNKKQLANKKLQIDILAKRLKELEEDASLNVIDASTNTNAPYNTQFNLIELNELPFPLFDEIENDTAIQPIQTSIVGYREFNLFSVSNGNDKKHQRSEENTASHTQHKHTPVLVDLSNSLKLLPPPEKRAKLHNSQEGEQTATAENQALTSTWDDDALLDFLNSPVKW